MKKTLFSLALALGFGFAAMAQQTGPVIYYPHQGDLLDTIGAQTMGSNATTTITNSGFVPLRPGAVIAFYPVFSNSAAGTSNVTFNIQTSPWTNGYNNTLNGPGNVGPGTTNYSTVAPSGLNLTPSVAMNGTNIITGYFTVTNLPGARLTIPTASTVSTNGIITLFHIYWYYQSQ